MSREPDIDAIIKNERASQAVWIEQENKKSQERSLSSSERICEYNRLLRIKEELGEVKHQNLIDAMSDVRHISMHILSKFWHRLSLSTPHLSAISLRAFRYF